MKKKLLPICAMALLAVGYSSVASADTGTVTKEDAAQVQQDKAKKKKRLRYSKRVMRRKASSASTRKNDMTKKKPQLGTAKNAAVKRSSKASCTR